MAMKDWFKTDIPSANTPLQTANLQAIQDRIAAMTEFTTTTGTGGVLGGYGIQATDRPQNKRRTNINIEEVANGKVVTVGSEQWVVADGGSVLDVIAAALASNKLGIK